MIVRHLDLIRIALPPLKADPPLLVDPDAVLPGPIPRKLLEPVARGNPQVAQIVGGVEHEELPKGGALQFDGPPPHSLSLKDLLGVRVPEALDHVVS